MSDRRKAARMRRYRNRQRAGSVVAPTPVSPEVVELLIALHWLDRDVSESRQAIGEAISCMLAECAANSQKFLSEA